MQIATELQHRALAFVDACNKGGYSPSQDEIELWLTNPEPRPARFEDPIITPGLSSSIASMLRFLRGRMVEHAEAGIVVLQSDDPLAYATMVGQLSKAENGFLVDPYFRMGQLLTILNSTTISRVLISKQHRNSSQTRAELTTALDILSLPRRFEIRATSDPALHDRLAVSENGQVWTLGASL